MQYVDVPLLKEIEQILQNGVLDHRNPGVNIDKPFLTSDVSEALTRRFSYVKISNANISKALRVLGFEQKRVRDDRGRMKRYWFKKESDS